MFVAYSGPNPTGVVPNYGLMMGFFDWVPTTDLPPWLEDAGDAGEGAYYIAGSGLYVVTAMLTSTLSAGPPPSMLAIKARHELNYGAGFGGGTT